MSRAAGWRSRIVGHGEEAPDQLLANPKNWRIHPEAQQDALEGVLDEVGWVQDVVVNQRSGHLVDGHLRVLLALRRHEQSVPVVYVDLSEQEEALVLAALDPVAAMAAADKKKLDLLLHEVQTSSAGVQAMLADLAEAEGLYFGENGRPKVEDVEPQMDRAGELQKKWGTEAGQLWALGEHRLICGDCTDKAVVERVMGGGKSNICFTSPPYAEQRTYDEGSGFKPIPPGEYVAWWAPIQEAVKTSLSGDGSFFINIKPAADGLDTSLYVFDLVIAHVRLWGWHFATEFCWERAGIPKSVTRRFKNQFEPIYQFSLGDWKMRPDAVKHHSENVPRARGKGAGNTSWKDAQGGGSLFMSGHQGEPGFEWFGDDVGVGMAYPGNRLPTFSGSHEALGHTAAFPVGLPSFFIKAYTDENDVVFDPFSGSGTTIMACEQLGRQCRAIEISPAYVAVALERWSVATGRQPELLESIPATEVAG